MPLFVAAIIRLWISSAGQKTAEVGISDLQLCPYVMSVRLGFRLAVIAAPDGQLWA